MRSVAVLLRKELRQMFLSPIAYAFLLVFVFFMTFMFFRAFFLVQQVSMARFFDLMPISFAIVVPGITMRTWAEERKQGTIEYLQTAPVQTWQIVLGKFFAGLSLIALFLLLTIGVPLTVGGYGDLDTGPVWGGYIGSLLLGGMCIAIGMLLSVFTTDQIVSFLVGVSVLLTLVLVGSPFIMSEFGGGSFFGSFVRTISPTPHFESVGRGVIDLRDVYYFVAMTALFLYLNMRVLDVQKRH